MIDNTAIGILACVAAGMTNGSFAMPMKRIRAWKWEHTWFAYTIFANATLPVAAAAALAPGLFDILVAQPTLALRVAFFGALWGAGSALFGMSLVRLGLAVGNALISSILVLVGSVGPVLTGAARMGAGELPQFLLAVTPLLAGIGLCAAASLARDRAAGAESGAPDRRSLSGLAMAVGSGVLSSMLNMAFAVGAPLASQASAAGYNEALATLAIWVPALAGGGMVGLIYTGGLVHRGGAWLAFCKAPDAGASWARTFLMGVLWFGAIFIYGNGASLLGKAGTVYAWAMTTGMSILTANGWGAATGEWRGSGIRPKVLMVLATALMIASFVVLALQRSRTGA